VSLQPKTDELNFGSQAKRNPREFPLRRLGERLRADRGTHLGYLARRAL
jgi:hypothetical protein